MIRGDATACSDSSVARNWKKRPCERLQALMCEASSEKSEETKSLAAENGVLAVVGALLMAFLTQSLEKAMKYGL